MKTTACCTIIISSFILLPLCCFAKPGQKKPRHGRNVRNAIWFHPNRARIINGLALGPFNFQSFRMDSSLTVNGINLEAPGVGLFPLPVQESYITVNGLDISPLRYSGTCSGLALGVMSSSVSSYGCQLGMFSGLDRDMHGLHVALLGASSGNMRGVQIGGFSGARTAKGVTMAFWMCISDSMSGFTLAALNYTKRQRGLQLGVVNYAKELRGLQFGLINVAPNCRRKVMPVMQVGRRRGKLK